MAAHRDTMPAMDRTTRLVLAEAILQRTRYYRYGLIDQLTNTEEAAVGFSKGERGPPRGLQLADDLRTGGTLQGLLQRYPHRGFLSAS